MIPVTDSPLVYKKLETSTRLQAILRLFIIENQTSVSALQNVHLDAHKIKNHKNHKKKRS
jgi:hypothetical protein